MSPVLSLEQSQFLYEKIVERRLIPRLRGQFVFRELIPEEMTPGIEFHYFHHKNIGMMANKIGENDIPPDLHPSFLEQVDKCEWYGKKSTISMYLRQTDSILFRDQILQDIAVGLADSMALREEYERMKALVNRTIPSWIGSDADFEKDLSVGGQEWVGGSPLSIIDHLFEASSVMRKKAKVVPTDLIVGPDVALAFLREPEIRFNWLAGQFQNPVLSQGHLVGGSNTMGAPGTFEMNDLQSALLGVIGNIRVWVSNVHVLKEEKNDVEELPELMLEDTAILLSTKGMLGRMKVFGGTESYSVPEMRTRTLEFFVRKCMKVVLYRPQNAYLFKNVIATP